LAQSFPDDINEIRAVISILSNRHAFGHSGAVGPKIPESEGDKVNKVHYPCFDDFNRLIGSVDIFPPDRKKHLLLLAQAVFSVMEPSSIEDITLLFVANLFCKERLNSFGQWSHKGDCLAIVIYPSCSFYNHSCLPNAQLSTEDQRNGIITCTKAIKAGEEVNIAYSYFNDSDNLEHRREYLSWSYLFTCRCSRCSQEEKEPAVQKEDKKTQKRS